MPGCGACGSDVQSTTYGRCPLCGAVLAPDVARERDEARRRAPASRDDGDDAPGACGTGCLVLLGILALVACAALIGVGQRARWTSDGPGILLVMLAVGVTGLVAVACLGGALLSQSPTVRRASRLLERSVGWPL